MCGTAEAGSVAEKGRQMGEQKETDMKFVDASEISKAMANIAERSQRIVTDFLSRQAGDGPVAGLGDPLHIGDAFLQMTTKLMADPAKLVEAQMNLWQDYMQL